MIVRYPLVLSDRVQQQWKGYVMTTNTAQRTRTVGIKKIIAAIMQRPINDDGLHKIGIASEVNAKFTSSFWTFTFPEADEIRVDVYFDPKTEMLKLVGKARELGDVVGIVIRNKTFEAPTWPQIETHSVNIDDIVNHGLKQPLMALLGLKPDPARQH